MKNLIKLVMLVIILIVVASCSKKKVEFKKNKKTEIINLQSKKQKNEFLLNSKTLTNNEGVFFENFFKNKDLRLWTRSNEYTRISMSQKITYIRYGKKYSGILANAILAIWDNDKLNIEGGYIIYSDNIKMKTIDFELYIFPKTIPSFVAAKFAQKYEGTYSPIDEENVSKNLESFNKSVNYLGKWGNRIDYVRIYNLSYGIELVGYDVFAYDKNRKLKELRWISMEKRGERFVDPNFKFLPRSQY